MERTLVLPHEDGFTKTFDGSAEGRKAGGKSRFSALNFPLYSGEVGSSAEPRRWESFQSFQAHAPPPPLPAL